MKRYTSLHNHANNKVIILEVQTKLETKFKFQGFRQRTSLFLFTTTSELSVTYPGPALGLPKENNSTSGVISVN
jgi:hypothetical protein